MRLLKSGVISEYSIQKAALEWCVLRKVDKHTIHIPNEGRRSTRAGYMLKQIGMLPGVSDLFVALPRHGFHGAWIEIKSESGKTSKAQLAFQKLMIENNYYAVVTVGLDDTLNKLNWYCFGGGREH